MNEMDYKVREKWRWRRRQQARVVENDRNFIDVNVTMANPTVQFGYREDIV